MVVDALFTAGLQIPVMPLLDVVGNVKLLPAHWGAILSNVGTTGAFTTTVNCAVVAHAPAFGEKVYVVVVVLFTAGFQVPATPLLELAGKLKLVPEQTGSMALNKGCVGAKPEPDALRLIAVVPERTEMLPS